jgi:metallo-beta-lactamase class B
MSPYGYLIVLCLLALGCGKTSTTEDNKNYKSETLLVEKLTDNVYQHISFLQTDDFGNVACNGVVFVHDNEAIVFDAPTTNGAAVELISWIEDHLNASIVAVIPNHFHEDCLGGLAVFHGHKIPSYANNLTIELSRQNNSVEPRQGFERSLELMVGGKKVFAEFIGEGHTKDNIIGYFPDDETVFGGCLIKELGAGKGYLGDANVMEWSGTVVAVKQKHPNASLIIPGHGQPGGKELLDYTAKLFEPEK